LTTRRATSTPFADGITDAGQIVGYFIGTTGAGTGGQGFEATPTSGTPEPSTLGMMWASLLGTAGYLAPPRVTVR